MKKFICPFSKIGLHTNMMTRPVKGKRERLDSKPNSNFEGVRKGKMKADRKGGGEREERE